MAENKRLDPYKSFKFKLEMDGKQAAAFSEAIVPDARPEPIIFRESEDPNYTRKFSGLTSYGSLSLKKGATNSQDLIAWANTMQAGGVSPNRKNITLLLFDEAGRQKVSWNIINAWPSKFESTGSLELNNEFLIELLELQIEGIERIDTQ